MKRRYLNLVRDNVSQDIRNYISPIFRAFEDFYVSLRCILGFSGVPKFLLIGAQKSGTTSLYNEIVSHPSVCEVFRKEIGYFNKKYKRYPINWYFSNFPSGDGLYFGEATPDYLFDNNAPSIISKSLPNIKLIVILRDPIERAVSHYFHEKRLGREKLSLKLALEKESARLQPEYGCIDDPAANYSFRDRNHYFSYIARGKYGEQLSRWMNIFPRKQLHVVHFEDFKQNPSEVLKMVFAFLEINEFKPTKKASNENRGNYDRKLDVDTESYRENFVDDQALLCSMGFGRFKNDI